MVAWWLAGADSKGRGKGETELECPTIGLEGEQLPRVVGGACHGESDVDAYWRKYFGIRG
jgi:hypothetical protein